MKKFLFLLTLMTAPAAVQAMEATSPKPASLKTPQTLTQIDIQELVKTIPMDVILHIVDQTENPTEAQILVRGLQNELIKQNVRDRQLTEEQKKRNREYMQKLYELPTQKFSTALFVITNQNIITPLTIVDLQAEEVWNPDGKSLPLQPSRTKVELNEGTFYTIEPDKTKSIRIFLHPCFPTEADPFIERYLKLYTGSKEVVLEKAASPLYGLLSFVEAIDASEVSYALLRIEDLEDDYGNHVYHEENVDFGERVKESSIRRYKIILNINSSTDTIESTMADYPGKKESKRAIEYQIDEDEETETPTKKSRLK